MAIATTVTVRPLYADTDQMGIVYHAKYLEWFEQGRNEQLRELGIPYTRVEADGFYLPVYEAYVRYRRPAKYDDVLIIKTILQEVPDVRFTIYYEVINAKDEVITKGHTVHSFVDRTGKPVRPPDWLVERIRDAMSEYQ